MTVPLIPTVLIVGFLGAIFGGGIMFRITRNWRAAAIVACAALVTTFLWLLPEFFA